MGHLRGQPQIQRQVYQEVSGPETSQQGPTGANRRPQHKRRNSGGEEWAENNLQVSWRVRVLRCTDLLEAAFAFPRHGTPAQIQI